MKTLQIKQKDFEKMSELYQSFYEIYGNENTVWDIDELEEMRKMGQEFMEIMSDNFENKKIKCIIIHGCPPNAEKEMNPKTRTYDKHWIPWIKKELIAKGIKTEAPLMPLPWNPDYEKFKKEFEKYKVTKDTILIGHSCSCAFLVR